MVRTVDFKVHESKSTKQNASTFNHALKQRLRHPSRWIYRLIFGTGRGKGSEKLGYFSTSCCGRLSIGSILCPRPLIENLLSQCVSK